MVTPEQDSVLLGIEADVDRLRRPGVLTGEPSVWGPVVWDMLHQSVEIIPCGTCKDEGRLLVSAAHDAVNAHLGKPVRDPRAVCIVTAQLGSIACTYDQCVLTDSFHCDRHGSPVQLGSFE